VCLSILNAEIVKVLACLFPRWSAWFAGLVLGNHHFILSPLPAIFVIVATGLVSLLLFMQRGLLALGTLGLDLVDRKGSFMKLTSYVAAYLPFKTPKSD
jgi:hypothetical protein